jgi:hypothetical protein
MARAQGIDRIREMLQSPRSSDWKLRDMLPLHWLRYTCDHQERERELELELRWQNLL